MKRLIILAPALVLIAACSRGPDKIQDGQWELTYQLTGMDIPGAPPEAQTQMRAQLNHPATNRVCITSAWASNPMAEVRRAISTSPQNPNCHFTDDTYGNGRVKIHATCQQPGGPGRADVLLEGSFTATTGDLTLTASGEGLPMAAGAGNARVTATVRGRRVGDCPATPAAPTMPMQPTQPMQPAPQ
jgi:hypothetical protein